MDREELLWRQFEQHVGLYKHYLDLVLKMNGAYYAITGAIVSFFLANRADGMSRAGLLVPLVLGVGISILFVYGAIMLRYTRDEMIEIRDALELATIPETKALVLLLWLSVGGIATVSLGLILVWWRS